MCFKILYASNSFLSNNYSFLGWYLSPTILNQWLALVHRFSVIGSFTEINLYPPDLVLRTSSENLMLKNMDHSEITLLIQYVGNRLVRRTQEKLWFSNFFRSVQFLCINNQWPPNPLSSLLLALKVLLYLPRRKGGGKFDVDDNEIKNEDYEAIDPTKGLEINIYLFIWIISNA